MKKIVVSLIALAFAGAVFAHSGGTDKYGCHKDHRTGIYHCH